MTAVNTYVSDTAGPGDRSSLHGELHAVKSEIHVVFFKQFAVKTLALTPVESGGDLRLATYTEKQLRGMVFQAGFYICRAGTTGLPADHHVRCRIIDLFHVSSR
jgi:hypothetical protein